MNTTTKPVCMRPNYPRRNATAFAYANEALKWLRWANSNSDDHKPLREWYERESAPYMLPGETIPDAIARLKAFHESIIAKPAEVLARDIITIAEESAALIAAFRSRHGENMDCECEFCDWLREHSSGWEDDIITLGNIAHYCGSVLDDGCPAAEQPRHTRYREPANDEHADTAVLCDAATVVHAES
jgi:hypothetical protein